MTKSAAFRGPERKRRRLERFQARMTNRFSLRFTMFLILVSVVFSGIISDILLLKAGMSSVLLRYPFSVIFSYLAFFVVVRLWLGVIRGGRKVTRNSNSFTDGWMGSEGSFPSLSSSKSEASGFSGKGGDSGGAGASGSWSGGSQNSFAQANEARAVVLSTTALQSAEVDSGSRASSSSSSSSTGGGGASDDSGIVMVIALVVAVVSVIVIASVYLISLGPVILGNAAFQFAMGSGLIRTLKKVEQPDWAGSLFKQSFLPFFIVLVVCVFCAVIFQTNCPGLESLSEAWDKPGRCDFGK